MAVSSTNHLFLALILLLALTYSISAAARTLEEQTSTEFIRTSCGATTYPELCFSSLSAHARVIQTSPMLLAHTALSVTLDTTRDTSAMMGQLVQSSGLSGSEAAAMRDCVEEVSDSVDQLRQSLAEMKQLNGPNFGLIMNDIQTWVSAALTNDDTCNEGFAGAPAGSGVRSQVRGRILNVAHMTSNALALINSYASIHG